MFRGRMTGHEVRKPTETDDGLGFKSFEYSEPTEVLMYLTTPTQTEFNQNEFYLSHYAATALTYEEVELKSLVDDEWRVDSVTRLKGESATPVVVEYVLGLNKYGE